MCRPRKSHKKIVPIPNAKLAEGSFAGRTKHMAKTTAPSIRPAAARGLGKAAVSWTAVDWTAVGNAAVSWTVVDWTAVGRAFGAAFALRAMRAARLESPIHKAPRHLSDE